MEDSRHSLYYEIIGRMVRSMLHDLNSPLSSIIGYSSKNINQSIDPDQDWHIVYEQGLSLSENVKFWQSLARQQFPQYDRNIITSARYVFRAFKSIYASRLSLALDDKCEELESAKINVGPSEMLHFWVYLFKYFILVLPEQQKGKLRLTFCDEENISIQAELQVDDVVKCEFSENIAKHLREIFEEIAIQREVSDNRVKFVLQKQSVQA